MKKRKAFYWTDAAQWIADNDNPGDGDDAEMVSQYVTVAMASDLTGIPEMQIAQLIITLREIQRPEATR